jgi:hypothetical protein
MLSLFALIALCQIRSGGSLNCVIFWSRNRGRAARPFDDFSDAAIDRSGMTSPCRTEFAEEGSRSECLCCFHAIDERPQVTAPARERHVANCELGTIDTFEPGGRLQLRLDSGRTIDLSAISRVRFDHGFALTSHSSQGQDRGSGLGQLGSVRVARRTRPFALGPSGLTSRRREPESARDGGANLRCGEGPV